MKNPLTKGRRVEVIFTGYDEDGRAVGPGPDGVEVRVPGGVRGEPAEVKIAHVSPHQPVAWARLRRVLEPAPGRLHEAGSLKHVCGGCPWAHLHPEEELSVKREWLEDLADACPEATLGQPVVVSSPRREGYRNRAKYVVGRVGEGLVLGGYVPRSHHVVRTVECPVTARDVAAAAAVVEDELTIGPWSVYDEKTRTGLLRYVGIRANVKGKVLVTLVTAQEPEPSFAPLVTALRSRIKGLLGVDLDVNPGPGNVVFSGRGRVLWGAGELEERYGPARVRLSGHGFGQVNRGQAGTLYGMAARAALAPLAGGDPPTRITELFAGAGALAQVIAHEAGPGGPAVHGVERDEDAVRLASSAARDLGLERLSFSAGDAQTWLRGQGDAARPEVVVLDPPRAGCKRSLLDDLRAAAIPRLVYVSCSLRTLGRDLAILREGGYRVATLQGFDMMPLTPHLEALAVLEL